MTFSDELMARDAASFSCPACDDDGELCAVCKPVAFHAARESARLIVARHAATLADGLTSCAECGDYGHGLDELARDARALAAILGSMSDGDA